MSSYGFNESSTGIIPGMTDVYNQLLKLNEGNYSNILGAYASGQQKISATIPGIAAGYGQLGGDVMKTLGVGGGGWGVAAPAAQAIGDMFKQTNAATTQQMVNSGLGNTTIGANLQNQNALQAGRAYAGLGSQLAQTAAGYQAQLGMAGLGTRMAGLGQSTGLTSGLGGALASKTFANTAGALTGGVSKGATMAGVGMPGGHIGGGAYGPGMATSATGGGYGAPLQPYNVGTPGAGGNYGYQGMADAALAEAPPAEGYGYGDSYGSGDLGGYSGEDYSGEW